jgi:hypothetical protein
MSFLRGQVARMAAHLRVLAPDEPFLRELAAELLREDVEDGMIGALLRGLRELMPRMLSEPAHQHLPLGRLVDHFRLSTLEGDLLLVAMLPELDDRFGALFARLRGAGSVRRPTLGMALRALVLPDARWGELEALQRSRLWHRGLLVLEDVDLPFPDRTLRPTTAVIAGLEGRLPEHLGSAARVSWLLPAEDDGLSLALLHWRSLATRVDELARWTELVGDSVVCFVAGDATRARSLAGGVAHRLKRPVLRVEAHSGGEASLREAVTSAVLARALLHVELRAGVDHLRIPDDLGLKGPLLVTAAERVRLELPRTVPSRRCPSHSPRPAEQAALWQHLVEAAGGQANLDHLGNQTWLSVGEISRIVDLAASQAKLAGRGRPDDADFRAALAELPDPILTIARVYRPDVSWSRLILPPRAKQTLESLVQRVRHRVTVQDRWGMRHTNTRGNGLVALFHGASGTGKTLAAEATATSLGLPLVAVDLSQVVSKYIGETEKNLAEVFDAAEGFRAVLLFDEADSLFAKRTAVRDAHDRYANLETSYLLQRLESLEGIGFLATNLRQNLDDAFTRRIHFSVAFPQPTAQMQIELWKLHLPGDHTGLTDEDLSSLARFDLVGGEIRNASLAAAYDAAAAGRRIDRALLEEASRQELFKRGRVAPA